MTWDAASPRKYMLVVIVIMLKVLNDVCADTNSAWQ